jgi:hypothetical protein
MVPPAAASGETWPMDRPEVPPEKRPSVIRAHFAQAHRLEVGGGVEHLLHAGAALGTFVADHHHLAGLHLAAEDAGHRRVLALEDPGRAAEGQVVDGPRRRS